MILPSNIACVYLHGFLSSPKSKKAQELIHFFDNNQMKGQLIVPTLSFEPVEAIQQAQDAIDTLKQQPGIDQVFVMGSSLGGFYANYLAEKENLKAVLINPAVRPFELFDKYLGLNEHFYDGQSYLLELKHIEQLKQLEVAQLSKPKALFLLLQTGDETLDYQLATEKYQNCPSWIEPGGNHSFEGFSERLDSIFHFACR
ncbi:MAG: YqiA/YcfP family alpha/beta fold hydrolase [Oleispira sp.]